MTATVQFIQNHLDDLDPKMVGLHLCVSFLFEGESAEMFGSIPF